MLGAEMLFTAGTGNVCQTAKETLISAVGAENTQRVTEEMREKLAALPRASDRAAAIDFVHELKGRGSWAIDPANLTALLAVRYGASPVSEFTDGHVSKYEGTSDPKLLGVELSLKVPRSWKEMPAIGRMWSASGSMRSAPASTRSC